METVRLILGSKAFATIAGGSLLMILGAALGVAIGSDPNSSAATEPVHDHEERHHEDRRGLGEAEDRRTQGEGDRHQEEDGEGAGSTGRPFHTVTGPTHTVTDVRTRTVTTTVTTTITA